MTLPTSKEIAKLRVESLEVIKSAGDLIEEIRSHRITQQKLAKDLRCHYVYLSQVKAGVRKPDLLFVQRLARYYEKLMMKTN